MIWISAGLLAFIVMTIMFWIDEWNDWWEKVLFPFVAFLMSMGVAFLVLILVSLPVSLCADIDYRLESDTNIVALKDNQSVTGIIYIMGGYVDEDLYYYYATETEFGYTTEKVKSGDTYIRYTDAEPHIETYVGEFTNDWVNWFAMPMVDNRYIIYCPEGTMTTDFEIDLE